MAPDNTPVFSRARTGNPPPSTPDANPADAAIEAPKPLPSLGGGAAALAQGQALHQEVAALYAAVQSDEVRSVAPVGRACAQYTSLPATKVRVEDLLKSAGYSRAEPAAPPAGLFSTLAAWLMQLRFRLLTRGRK